MAGAGDGGGGGGGGGEPAVAHILKTLLIKGELVFLFHLLSGKLKRVSVF